jgi:hypothetical protein
MHDDAQSPCFFEEERAKKWAKMHHMETSEFLIPFYQVQTDINGKRDFYQTMVQKRGVSAKFKLLGFFGPPTVESKPLFLSLEPYCKAHQAHCDGISGHSCTARLKSSSHSCTARLKKIANSAQPFLIHNASSCITGCIAL